MAETENTIELMKLIDKQYVETIQDFRNAAQAAPQNSVTRDIHTLFKKVLNRMHRLYPQWKTMYHGSFGYEDDGQGNLRVLMATDVGLIFGKESAPRALFEVTTIDPAQYSDHPITLDPTERFFDELENYTNSYPDDLLIASNFIGHADAMGYRCRKMATVILDNRDSCVQVILTKKDRGISLLYNMTTPFKDHTQIHDIKHPTVRH